MHRVELKAFSKPDKFTFLVSVPNAPCGVESQAFEGRYREGGFWFLMHRVELKVEKRPFPIELINSS